MSASFPACNQRTPSRYVRVNRRVQFFSTGLRLRGAPLARRYSKEGHVLIEVDKQY